MKRSIPVIVALASFLVLPPSSALAGASKPAQAAKSAQAPKPPALAKAAPLDLNTATKEQLYDKIKGMVVAKQAGK